MTSRETALGFLCSDFAQKLQESIQESCPEEEKISDEIQSRFTNSFANFLDRGFDSAFRPEISAKFDASHQTILNKTVTEEDLLRLDEALQVTTARRRHNPARVSEYMDKILEHKAVAASLIKTDFPTKDVFVEVDGCENSPVKNLVSINDILGHDSQLVLDKEELFKSDRAIAQAKEILNQMESAQ